MLHAGVVARISEQHAVRNAERTENPPAVHEANLAGREHGITGVTDVPIVK